jgi:GT2 family glycosyltransferase
VSPPVYVVVPVKDHLELTQRLVDQLVEQGGHRGIFVFDNGSTDGTAAWLDEQAALGRLEAVDAAGLTLHKMWNAGIDLALARDEAPHVAILNNDLVLGSDFCRRLGETLDADPQLWAVSPNYDGRSIDGVEYVTSTFKNGGLAGFAFMVSGGALGHVWFDEALHWWYGDDDLVAQIEAAGRRVGITSATTIEHVDGGSQTIRYSSDVMVAIEHDVLFMYEKWGHM